LANHRAVALPVSAFGCRPLTSPPVETEGTGPANPKVYQIRLTFRGQDVPVGEKGFYDNARGVPAPLVCQSGLPRRAVANEPNKPASLNQRCGRRSSPGSVGPGAGVLDMFRPLRNSISLSAPSANPPPRVGTTDQAGEPKCWASRAASDAEAASGDLCNPKRKRTSETYWYLPRPVSSNARQ